MLTYDLDENRNTNSATPRYVVLHYAMPWIGTSDTWCVHCIILILLYYTPQVCTCVATWRIRCMVPHAVCCMYGKDQQRDGETRHGRTYRPDRCMPASASRSLSPPCLYASVAWLRKHPNIKLLSPPASSPAREKRQRYTNPISTPTTDVVRRSLRCFRPQVRHLAPPSPADT